MIRFECGCGRGLKVDPKHEGRAFKCPVCGADHVVPGPQVEAHSTPAESGLSFPFPADEAGGLDELLDEPAEVDRPSPRETVRATGKAHESPVRREDEPASYRVVAGVASVIGYLGAMQFLLLFGGIVLPVIQGYDAPAGLTFGIAVGTLAGSFMLAVSCLFLSAFVAVFVDSARTLRDIRATLRTRG